MHRGLGGGDALRIVANARASAARVDRRMRLRAAVAGTGQKTLVRCEAAPEEDQAHLARGGLRAEAGAFVREPREGSPRMEVGAGTPRALVLSA